MPVKVQKVEAYFVIFGGASLSLLLHRTLAFPGSIDFLCG
jgi:hypothetical protein